MTSSYTGEKDESDAVRFCLFGPYQIPPLYAPGRVASLSHEILSDGGKMKKNKVMTWVNPKSKWADSFQKMFDEMFDERFNEVMKLTDKKVRKELELALKHRSLPQTHKHLKRKRGI